MGNEGGEKEGNLTTTTHTALEIFSGASRVLVPRCVAFGNRRKVPETGSASGEILRHPVEKLPRRAFGRHDRNVVEIIIRVAELAQRSGKIFWEHSKMENSF